MTADARAARDFRHKHEAATFDVIAQTRAGQRMTHAHILAAARQRLMRWTSDLRFNTKHVSA